MFGILDTSTVTLLSLSEVPVPELNITRLATLLNKILLH